MKKYFLTLFIFLSNLLTAATNQAIEDQLKVSLYDITGENSPKEITSKILNQIDLPEGVKNKLIKDKRRFFVFTYPSDGMLIKSMISFIDNSEDESLILILRGASRMEALPAFIYPEKALLFAAESKATIVLGTHRDGVSEGEDEYGGSDVNDVLSLSLHLPKIANFLGIKVDEERKYLIGISRGGMQMYLALAKFPELQSLFKKYVSLSGLLNTNISAIYNPGWLTKMEKNFKFDGSQAWLNARNPILAVPKIANKQLPFLLIQGTKDPRICLDEGYSMLKVMRENSFDNISYWEVAGGDHGLKNDPEYIKMILEWLKK